MIRARNIIENGAEHMNWITNHKKINLTVLIGLILIISALSIWIYSIIELKGNEILLTTQNIPIEEVWRAKGALQWWKNFYTTTIIPATTILIISGIATILSPQIRGFAQKVALRKRGLTVVEEEAVSSKDNIKEEPTVVLQNLISEETNLKGEKKELESLRENLQ